MSDSTAPLAALAEPLEMRGRRLQNRTVFAPMDRSYCDLGGRITDRYVAYMAERAAGGAALVIPEATYVRIDGKNQPHQMGMHEDSIVPDLARLAESVHQGGGLLGVQLSHGGNTSRPKVSGFRPVSPSGVPCRLVGGFEPDVLEHEDVLELVQAYADAARRGVEAGVDVLMVHAAHGYLVHQFMMPRLNRREDEFGDPVRFLEAVTLAVREVAPELPIFLRISAKDDPENGLDPDATHEIVSRAPLAEIDCIDVSAGSYEAPEWIIPVGERPEAWLGDLATRFRDLGPRVSVAGRVATLETAGRLVESGISDLVSVARAFHADPRWAGALVGLSGTPRPCISCNLCIDELAHGAIRCTVNARAGRELDFPPDPSPPLGDDRVRDDEIVIVGAGPAGMELARRLAVSGRLVRLLDRAEHMGGQFALAASLRCYPQYHRILDWYARELEQLGVVPELGTEVDEEWLRREEPGTVVLATGGQGFLPNVPGIDLPSVHDVRDWLRTGWHEGGGPFLVWGADREGMAVADDLLARGASVILVVAGERFPRDAGQLAKALVHHRLLTEPSCSVRFSSSVVAITPEGVDLSGPEGEERVEGPVTVLVSQGVEPENELRMPARRLEPPGGLHMIGDAAGMGGTFGDAITGSVQLANDVLAVRSTNARL